MEQVNMASFNISVQAQGQVLGNGNQCVEGVLKDGMIELEISVESSECGMCFAYFYIEIEDGSPASFSCKANFRGPIINIVEPVIDLGLTKVNTTK
jgi:hypothetical protein